MKFSHRVLMLGSLAVVGCQNIRHEDVGTVSGGVIGGLLGSQFGSGTGKVAAAAGGALLGAYLGGNIGKTMDKVDRMEMQRSLETTPTGHEVHWHNPDTGNDYSIRPTQTYYHHHQPCRVYTTRAVIEGRVEQVHGRACRRSDGTWHVVQ